MVDKNQAEESKSRASLEDEVEEVLGDIESNSSYALRHKTEAEVFDPGDIDSERQDLPGSDEIVDSELAPVDTVDELAEEIDVTQLGALDSEQDASALPEDGEMIERRRSRLRTILALAIVILLLIGAAIGVLLWQGTLSPNVKPSDTDELNTGSAGSETASFEPVSSNAIPALSTMFNLTLAEVQQTCGTSLVVGQQTEATDARIASMRSLVDGQLVNEQGVSIASVGLGLDEGGRLVYAYCSFDLDALAVADADFEDLAANDVVAGSILEALGVSSEAVDAASLDTEDNPNAVVADAAQNTKEAVFSGTTGLASPATFQVTESYDMSAGQTLGDNSVIRTLLVEFS